MNEIPTIDDLPNAPIVCDMITATDTPEDRLAEYGRLFAHTLVDRSRAQTSTTFHFAAKPGVRDWILDLVTRESACCRFLTYRITGNDDRIDWATSGEDSESGRAILNQIHNAPEMLKSQTAESQARMQAMLDAIVRS